MVREQQARSTQGRVEQMNMVALEWQFLSVDDVRRVLNIGRTKAYQIIRQLNSELDKKGYMIQCGRVPAKYFAERFNID